MVNMRFSRQWPLLLLTSVLVVPAAACLNGYGVSKPKSFKVLKSETKRFAHSASKKLTKSQEPVHINGTMPDFSVVDLYGRTFNRASFRGKMSLFVLADTQCPCVQAVEMRLLSLGARYKAAGLKPALIFSKPKERPLEVYSFMMRHQIPFPALLDKQQALLKGLDGQCSSEVYLFDKDSRLRYHGRVDDSTFDDKAVKSKDLEKAIISLTRGQKVVRPEVPAMGCSIPRL